MKRHFGKLIFSIAAAAALLFTGCRSLIEMRVLEERERLIAYELDLGACFSEGEGYHYPNVPWGQNFTDFQRATNSAVTDVEGYTEDGKTIFTAGDLHVMLLGRRNDAANMATKENDVVSFVSISFSPSDDPNVMKIDQLFTDYKKVLTDKFGEPTGLAERDETANGVTYLYETYYWDAEADGKKTELQWSSARVSGSESLRFVAIGFVWLDEEKEAEE
ncbi:MAG: hypothetical protein IK088_03065 [Lachnospiraceae bacterium]|nr:hypothetical protein [Lachnospiraceae bacterium]